MKLLNLDLTLRHKRYAGARRVRQGYDLAHYLAECTQEERDIAKRLLEQPPIGGAAQQVIFLTANAAALGAAQTTYIGPLTGIQQSPLILAMHYLPQIAGTTATATITLQMRRTDTPAVIENAVHLCSTADTNPGPFTIIGYLPIPSTTTTAAILAAGSGIDVQGAASAGAGTPTATATAPITLSAFGMA